MSSTSTMTTFGAPAGGFISKRGGAFAWRTSSSVTAARVGSAIGSTRRSSPSIAAGFCWAHAAVVRPRPAAITSSAMRRVLPRTGLTGRTCSASGTCAAGAASVMKFAAFTVVILFLSQSPDCSLELPQSASMSKAEGLAVWVAEIRCAHSATGSRSSLRNSHPPLTLRTVAYGRPTTTPSERMGPDPIAVHQGAIAASKLAAFRRAHRIRRGGGSFPSSQPSLLEPSRTARRPSGFSADFTQRKPS
jgi:hypothetical protein